MPDISTTNEDAEIDRARPVAAALVVGLVLGAATQIGQSVLPDDLSHIANSISVWVAVAFVVGSFAPAPRIGALTGFITLVGALVGYYALVFLRFGYTGGSGSLILWTIGALFGGAVFGAAGWYWRRADGLARIGSISLLGAVFVAEGTYFLVILPGSNAGIGFIVAGLIVPLLAARSWRERGLAYVGLIPALALGALGYVAVTVLGGALAGV